MLSLQFCVLEIPVTFEELCVLVSWFCSCSNNYQCFQSVHIPVKPHFSCPQIFWKLLVKLTNLKSTIKHTEQVSNCTVLGTRSVCKKTPFVCKAQWEEKWEVNWGRNAADLPVLPSGQRLTILPVLLLLGKPPVPVWTPGSLGRLMVSHVAVGLIPSTAAGKSSSTKLFARVETHKPSTAPPHSCSSNSRGSC